MLVVSNEDIKGTVWRQRRSWHGLYMNCCQAGGDEEQPGNNTRSEQDDMNADAATWIHPLAVGEH